MFEGIYMSRLFTFSLLCGAAWAFAVTAASAATAEDQIIGVFSDPIYSGFDANNPNVGDKLFIDNSSTAPASTFIEGGTLTWGAEPPPPPTVGTNFSQLTFTGSFVPFGDQNTPVQLGTITYTNGSSATDSIIFGATLTFFLNGIALGSDQVSITSTLNQSSGTSLTEPQVQLDADYINICGASSNICSLGLQAFENTEGTSGTAFSNPVVAALYGTYQIDPGVQLTDLAYQSGDGVVSDRSAPTPEPSTWALLLIGFLGLGAIGRRATRKAVAAQA
jgi:hypothetical protein